MELDQIINIESIAQGMSAVYFTYRLTQLAPWASNASLRFAFSEADNLIAGSTKTRYSATFRITKQGKLMLHSPPTPVELDSSVSGTGKDACFQPAVATRWRFHRAT
ncbi:MAG: hypothetical protein ACMZI0_17390 [Symbiopectobacterium sp.]|uniref:hypothetical protein n=1 Tax=Symbiopectobacterium sp. TaxID=2952789 RepID=UPI0039EAC216